MISSTIEWIYIYIVNIVNRYHGMRIGLPENVAVVRSNDEYAEEHRMWWLRPSRHAWLRYCKRMTFVIITHNRIKIYSQNGNKYPM